MVPNRLNICKLVTPPTRSLKNSKSKESLNPGVASGEIHSEIMQLATSYNSITSSSLAVQLPFEMTTE